MKRLLSTILLAGSLAPLMGLEIWPVGLDKVGNSPNMEWSDSDGMTLKVVNSDEGKQVMNVLKLKAEDVAGKTFKVSFEYKMDVEPGENKWSGGKSLFPDEIRREICASLVSASLHWNEGLDCTQCDFDVP